MLSLIALLILVIATLTPAAPLSTIELDTNFNITRRVNVPAGVSCAADQPWRYTYTSSVIERAKDHLERFMNLDRNDPRKPKTDSGTPYPHEFFTNNLNRSPQVLAALDKEHECRLGQPGKSYLEYPMVDYKYVAPYTGHRPGGDRIIMIVRGTQPGHYSNPTYCLSMTHEDVDGTNMIPCPTTMSPEPQN